MKKSALSGYLLTTLCFLVVFFPQNTRGIELPDNTVLVLQHNDASIYPNPVRDVLFIQIEEDWAQNADLQFEVRNILGNMMPLTVEKVEQNLYRIDTADYPSGYYLLMVQCKSCQVKGNKHRNTFKFLKQ